MPRTKKVKPFSKVGGPSQAQQESHLLALPAELRNRIYEFVFAGIEVKIPQRSKRANNTKGRTNAPGLLLACKQAHHEAVKIYYSLTTFEVDYVANYRLKEWARKIGPARVALINEVHLPGPSWDTDVWYESEFITPGSRAKGVVEPEMLQMTRESNLKPGFLKIRCRLNDWVWTSTPGDLVQEVCRAAKLTLDTRYVWKWVTKPQVEFENFLSYADSYNAAS